jgi:hypothetical protein
MGSLFVSRGSIRRFVDFHKDEFRWILYLLNYVEARNPGFFHTMAGILNRRLFESFYEFRLDIYMNKNYLHFLLLIKAR